MPRAMKDWNHLTLAEVAEVEELAAAIVGSRNIASQHHRRFAELLARRVRPQYEKTPDGAA